MSNSVGSHCDLSLLYTPVHVRSNICVELFCKVFLIILFLMNSYKRFNKIKLLFLSVLKLVYLPPPWGDCKATPMDSDFFSTFSITACRIDCETRYLVENCNCRMVHMPGKHTHTYTHTHSNASTEPDTIYDVCNVINLLVLFSSEHQQTNISPKIHNFVVIL